MRSAAKPEVEDEPDCGDEAEGESNVGRKTQRGKEAFDRSGDNEHRGDAGEEHARARGIQRDRVAASQAPGGEDSRRDEQTGRARDLDRGEFDEAVRRDRRPEIETEAGVCIHRAEAAEYQSVLYENPQREGAQCHATRERENRHLDVVGDDCRGFERRLLCVELEVRIVQTVVNGVGHKFSGKQRVRIGRMRTDDRIRDDRADDRERRTECDDAERTAKLLRKRVCVKTCESRTSRLYRAAVHVRMCARGEPVQVCEKPVVKRATLCVGEIACRRAVEAPDLLDVLAAQTTRAAPSGAPKERFKFFPRGGAPLNKRSLSHPLLRLAVRCRGSCRRCRTWCAMDRTLDVRTPESIALSYELAGVGSRFLAVTVDLLIQVAVFALVVWGLVALASHAPHATVTVHRATDRVAVNIAIGFVVFLVFLIFFGYYILFEGLWNGQTPGKKLFGLRVVRDGGNPIDFMAALVRNLIRVGELLIFGYVITGISALISPENKRIGDFAAGTIVVRDARMASPAALLREIAEEPIYAATTYLSGEERALVHRYLARRATFTVERRRVIAAQLANRLRPRMPADLQRLDDESLLERL